MSSGSLLGFGIGILFSRVFNEDQPRIINHLDKKDLKQVKNMLSEGNYTTTIKDYLKNSSGSGKMKIIHDINQVKIDHTFTLSSNVEYNRLLEIKRDVSGKIYAYGKGINNSTGDFSMLHLKLVALTDNQIRFIGYGSSNSSEKYHETGNVEFNMMLEQNGFSMKIVLDNRVACEIYYKKE